MAHTIGKSLFYFHYLFTVRNLTNSLKQFYFFFLITRLRESILPELQSCLPEYQLMSHAF